MKLFFLAFIRFSILWENVLFFFIFIFNINGLVCLQSEKKVKINEEKLYTYSLIFFIFIFNRNEMICSDQKKKSGKINAAKPYILERS